ncbi:MAG: hypothetical protein R2824_06030 [Saprospiraceae bacterium]
MDPIKSKLTLQYFLQKVEKLIGDEQGKLRIPFRRTKEIIDNLKEYVSRNNIINDDFWGYGIQRVTNGVKTITQAVAPEAGYLLTLFTIDGEFLKFFYIRLNYKLGSVQEILPIFSLQLVFIEKATYSINPPTLNIHSDTIDEILILRIDNPKHASYYSGEITRLFTSAKLESKKRLSLMERANAIMYELGERPEQEGDLKEILIKLDIDFLPGDHFAYIGHFDSNGFVEFNGSQIKLTHSGIKHLQEINLHSRSTAEEICLPSQILQPSQPTSTPGINIPKNSKRRLSVRWNDPPSRLVQIIGIIISIIFGIIMFLVAKEIL